MRTTANHTNTYTEANTKSHPTNIQARHTSTDTNQHTMPNTNDHGITDANTSTSTSPAEHITNTIALAHTQILKNNAYE